MHYSDEAEKQLNLAQKAGRFEEASYHTAMAHVWALLYIGEKLGQLPHNMPEFPNFLNVMHQEGRL